MDQKLEKTGPQSTTTFDSPTSRALGKLERMHPDSEWDAGDMGCGELVMELRIRLKPIRPGHILRLTARDPGATYPDYSFLPDLGSRGGPPNRICTPRPKGGHS